MAASNVKPMEMKIDGDTLTIVIDLRADLGVSKSGKSHIVATTNGNVLVGNGVKLGLNAYRPV